MISQETVLVQTQPGHLFLMRMAMKNVGDRSWAWVRRLEGNTCEGQGEARIWGKDPPDLPLPFSGHVILGQPHLLLSRSFCLICKVGILITHISPGLCNDQIGKKGCEKIT